MIGTYAIDGKTFFGEAEPADDDQLDWVVKGLVPRGAITFLAGQPKVGKSTIAMDMAIAAAAGQPFLGIEVTKPARVIVVCEEDSARTVRKRAWQVARAHAVDGRTLPVAWAVQFRFRLDDDDAVNGLLRQMTGGKCDLLILDALYKMHTADENSAREMAPIIKSLDRLTETGAAVVVVHHHRKEGKGDEHRGGGQLLRGTSSLFAASRSVITIDRPRENGPLEMSATGNSVSMDPIQFDLNYCIEGEGPEQSIRLERREATNGRRQRGN